MKCKPHIIHKMASVKTDSQREMTMFIQSCGKKQGRWINKVDGSKINVVSKFSTLLCSLNSSPQSSCM